jgi:hypothetical protein
MPRLPKSAPPDAKKLLRALREVSRQDRRQLDDDLKALHARQKMEREHVRLLMRGTVPRRQQEAFLREVDAVHRWERREYHAEVLKHRAMAAQWKDGFGPSRSKQTLIPSAPPRHPGGRPLQADPATLAEAKRLRGRLTREFQVARLDCGSAGSAGFLYQRSIRQTIEQELVDTSPAGREAVFQAIAAHGWKPSDAAARIAAVKFGIAFKRVRQGSNPIPRQSSKRRALVSFT